MGEIPCMTPSLCRIIKTILTLLYLLSKGDYL
nr:MAG TPA: hypothetical protein [Caudoviricetes sp.]